MPASILAVENLYVQYGHVEALKGISFEVRAHGITAFLGANGAGKSTTLQTISGLLKPASGTISFESNDITRLAPHKIVQRGVVQVPEGRAILSRLTVRENLVLGAYTRRDDIAQDLAWVTGLFPVLARCSKDLAGNLSGGEQQMLAIARALMARPRLLLLDEPSMGLAPIIVREIFAILQAINAAGITILLVEQNVRLALKIAQYAYVLETGRIVLSGSGEDLMHNQKVIDAYLGG